MKPGLLELNMSEEPGGGRRVRILVLRDFFLSVFISSRGRFPRTILKSYTNKGIKRYDVKQTHAEKE